jgi:hypothetical protein
MEGEIEEGRPVAQGNIRLFLEKIIRVDALDKLHVKALLINQFSECELDPEA